jgi:hypothetical protein
MALISPITSGSAVTYQSADGDGDHYRASSQARLHIRNGGGAPITLTVHSQLACSQGSTHDTTAVIGAGTDEILGPYDAARYADADGFVQLTYSGVTSLTVTVIA